MANYLGGYMRGAPDGGGDPGILGLYQFVQQGYDQGKARADAQALRQLSQRAYTDTGDAQQQDIAQMIGINPEYGRQQAIYAQQQQAQQQAAKLAQFQRLGKGANAVLQALQSGDQNAAQGIYQSMLPDIRMASAQHGGPEPTGMLDQDAIGNMTKLAAYYDKLPAQQQPYTLTPGSKRYNANNQVVADVPAQPKITPQGYQAVLGPDGTYHAEQIPIQGAGNGMGVGATVPGAGSGAAPQTAPGFQGSATSPSGQRVVFDFPPGTPPEVIAAAKASAVASGDIAPGQQIGGQQAQAPQTMAQAITSQKSGSDVISQRAQQIQELKARGVPMTPEQQQSYLTSGKLDAGFNANAPQPIGDTKLSGEARLASIDPDNKATVLAVLQGRKAPPSGTASKSSYWMGIVQAANAIDPTFDETSWPARVKTAQAYAPSGAQGSQIIALNTLVNHIGELNDGFNALHNTASPAYNAIANKIAYSTGLGAAGLPAYNVNAHAAAQEIETLWKKGGGNEADIKRYSDALSSSNSPAQQAQVVQKMLKLAYGRLQSLQSNYQNSMGIAGNGLNFVNDKSEAVIKSLAPDLATEYQQGSTALRSGQIAAGQQYAPSQGARVSTQAQYDALPSGATYVNANDGQTYRKP